MRVVSPRNAGLFGPSRALAERWWKGGRTGRGKFFLHSFGKHDMVGLVAGRGQHGYPQL